ncbi:hypothetical protein EMIT036CA2_60122 [Chryseobacterium sp. IT-36CA2]
MKRSLINRMYKILLINVLNEILDKVFCMNQKNNLVNTEQQKNNVEQVL